MKANIIDLQILKSQIQNALDNFPNPRHELHIDLTALNTKIDLYIEDTKRIEKNSSTLQKK